MCKNVMFQIKLCDGWLTLSFCLPPQQSSKTKWQWRQENHNLLLFIYPFLEIPMSLLLLLLLWLFLDPWVECKVLKKGWQMLQRDYARHVEATEVQVHILAGHFVCFHSNDSFCCCRLLGFWWWTSQSFQCILSPPQKSISWCCCNPHAHSPGKFFYCSCNFLYFGT